MVLRGGQRRHGAEEELVRVEAERPAERGAVLRRAKARGVHGIRQHEHPARVRAEFADDIVAGLYAGATLALVFAVLHVLP